MLGRDSQSLQHSKVKTVIIEYFTWHSSRLLQFLRHSGREGHVLSLGGRWGLGLPTLQSVS